MIRKAAAIAAITLAAAGCSSTSSTTTTPPGPPLPSSSSSMSRSPSPGGSTCDTSLWKHVYHPHRLHVITACLTVSGTVEEIKAEADGDTHLLLRLDPPYASLINSANKRDQHGDLVLEEICTGTVTQADAVTACRGLTSHAAQVHAGDHVKVTGSYVLDTAHGWDEIHPVSVMTVTR
jgi:hypothetical protein